MNFTCWIILFVSLLDRGHGRWKIKERENIEQDIKAFKKMAAEIEHKIDIYTDEENKINFEEVKQVFLRTFQHLSEHELFTHIKNKVNGNTSIPLIDTVLDSMKVRSTSSTPTEYTNVSFQSNIKNSNESKFSKANWPKFEDILLAMGRRYDWKNDRWIKVKRKFKEPNYTRKEYANVINFHEKHKFSYRTVKLSKSKSRKNVVIAVTAVR